MKQPKQHRATQKPQQHLQTPIKQTSQKPEAAQKRGKVARLLVERTVK
jgi:hypothetical protein